MVNKNKTLLKLLQDESLNYIKQNRPMDNLHLQRRFLMETLRRHEYDIPLVTVGHRDGLYVFGFLIIAFVF